MPVFMATGSPPRLWGKRRLYTMTTFYHQVHPHACGENIQAGARNTVAVGSPPRLWGKLFQTDCRAISWRFTPTPVGKTVIQAAICPASMVHPHACGENSFGLRVNVEKLGSPPRLWGKHAVALQRRYYQRFTPTPVGKTKRQTMIRSARAVHPHACGENRSIWAQIKYRTGSPPRLWGKRAASRIRAKTPRFTPTPVGKTRSSPR